MVGALANDCGVPGTDVGRITILERKSFVGLPRDVAERLLADGRPLSIRGNPIRMALAHR